MNKLTRIGNYIFWTLISLLFGFLHMRILLGPDPGPSTGFMRMFDWVHVFVLVRVGSIIGCIIAFLYILTDVCYLRKKLKNKSNQIIIRFLVVITIAVLTGVTHYVLEKVIDII